jgi:AhpD family alkylhydroperoxidase
MKKLIFASLMLTAGALAAHAQEAPQWMSTVLPEKVLDATWQEHRAVYADAALDGKTKHLIALATAAQIPCEYCILGHTTAARNAGASDEEIKEALAAAGQVRQLSTLLNGYQYDMAEFRAEIEGTPAGTSN